MPERLRHRDRWRHGWQLMKRGWGTIGVHLVRVSEAAPRSGIRDSPRPNSAIGCCRLARSRVNGGLRDETAYLSLSVRRIDRLATTIALGPRHPPITLPTGPIPADASSGRSNGSRFSIAGGGRRLRAHLVSRNREPPFPSPQPSPANGRGGIDTRSAGL